MRNNTIMMASPIKKTQQLSQGTNFHLKGLTNQFFLTSANQYKKGKPKTSYRYTLGKIEIITLPLIHFT